MYQRGIRGAITVENNTIDAIKNATIKLYSEIQKQNNYKTEDISHIIFTATKDLDGAYPAKFLREYFSIQNVPLMCMAELDIENSLKKCIRILVVINTNKTQNEINHIYLDGASILRPDLNKN